MFPPAPHCDTLEKNVLKLNSEDERSYYEATGRAILKTVPSRFSSRNIMKYRREIDGLRAVAVFPVILFHAGIPLFRGGFVGVDVFFVISGYLITSIIIAAKETGTFSLTNFYERRVRRILPALFIVLLFSTVTAWFTMRAGEMIEFSESLISVSVFASNIYFWRRIGYFDSHIESKPLIHTWSLAVEEQYYLIFPLFLMYFWRFGKRPLLLLLIAISASSLWLAHWGSLHKPVPTFYLLPARIWELMIGVLIAFYLFYKQEKPTHKLVSQLLSIAGVLLILYAVFAFDQYLPFPSLYTIVPTLGAGLIILFASEKTLVGKILASKPFVGIGLISYSAYLWHQPLLSFALLTLGERSKYLLVWLIVLSFVLAFISWKYVEMPCRNPRRFSRKKILWLGLISSVLFMSFGAWGRVTRGFAYRHSEQDRYLGSIWQFEEGKYVEQRFNEANGTNFDLSDPRRKILIIGDSFAQDLVSALYESGLASRMQISTRWVVPQCGNLFIARQDFVDKIEDRDLKSCLLTKGLYEDDALKSRMMAADEVWFVSRWRGWQAALIRESVAKVVQYTLKPVKVFGSKSFGNVDVKALLRKSSEERLATKGQIHAEVIETSAQIRSQLDRHVFIDVEAMLCGENSTECPQLTSDQGLISLDGWHLTKFGARYLGKKLVESGLIN